MIPVTSRIVVGFRTVTVIRISGCLTGTVTGLFRLLRPVHLIRCTDPVSGRLKRTIRTKFLLGELAPSGRSCHMVNHNICHHFGSIVMQSINQRFQIILGSPVAAKTAIAYRQITRSSRRFGHRRQPNQVKPLTYFNCLTALYQRLPFRITIPVTLITIPIETLEHHVRTLRRSSRAVRNRSVRIFTFPAIRTKTDIQLIRIILHFDIEIIASGYGNVVTLRSLIIRKSHYRFRIQRLHPCIFGSRVIQLAIIAFRHLHMR